MLGLVICFLVLTLVVLVGAFVIAVGIPFWKSDGTIAIANAAGALVVHQKPLSIQSNAAVINIPLQVGSTKQAGLFSGDLSLHVLTASEQLLYDARFWLMRQGTGQSNGATNTQSVTFTVLWEASYPQDSNFKVSFSTQSGQVYLNVARTLKPNTSVASTVNYTLFTNFQQSQGPDKILNWTA